MRAPNFFSAILFFVSLCLPLHAQEARDDRLRRFDVLTDGGYIDKAAWGSIEGVVDAPPEIVWMLFIRTNDWKNYRFPNLEDSRAADEELLEKLGDSKKREDFYKALGERVVDPLKNRMTGSRWSGYQFQYYDLPWPLADKWVILTNQYDETESKIGIYTAVWNKKTGDVKSIEGQIRFEPFEGDKNKTLMTYRVVSNPGSHIPRFMIKWGVKKALPSVMQTIRREASKAMRKPAMKR